MYNESMKADQIEDEALKLDPALRARLAERLFLSLDQLSGADWERVWSDEALRRDAEMDADPSLGTPAAEVFRKAHSKFK